MGARFEPCAQKTCPFLRNNNNKYLGPHVAREDETFLSSFQTLCTVFCTPTLSKDASEKKDWRILGFFSKVKKDLSFASKESERSEPWFLCGRTHNSLTFWPRQKSKSRAFLLMCKSYWKVAWGQNSAFVTLLVTNRKFQLSYWPWNSTAFPMITLKGKKENLGWQ